MNENEIEKSIAQAVEFDPGPASERVWTQVRLERRARLPSISEMLVSAAASAAIIMFVARIQANSETISVPRETRLETALIKQADGDEARLTMAMLRQISPSP